MDIKSQRIAIIKSRLAGKASGSDAIIKKLITQFNVAYNKGKSQKYNTPASEVYQPHEMREYIRDLQTLEKSVGSSTDEVRAAIWAISEAQSDMQGKRGADNAVVGEVSGYFRSAVRNLERLSGVS